MYSGYYKHYREAVKASYALIADIIRSRELPDRRRAQRVIHETLEWAAEGLALTQRPYATVGDELQAVSVTLADALALTMRTHLLLPEGLGLRFGIGVGAISEVEGAAGSGADGTPGRRSRTARHGGPHAKPSRRLIISRMRGGPSFAPG